MSLLVLWPVKLLKHSPFSQKTVQIKTLGSTGSRSSITELWGPKALDNIVDLEIRFEFEREKSTLKRVQTLAVFTLLANQT